MRVYIVQYKLLSDGAPCVPYSFNSRQEAFDQAQSLHALPSVYCGVRICSVRLPDYTAHEGCSVPVDLERAF